MDWVAETERYFAECQKRRCAPRATEFALRLHLTPVQLDRAFRAATGVKIGAYLKKLQIDLAKTLLATTTLSATTIATQAGFATPRSFFRAFRRTTGITPVSYRREKNVTGAAVSDFLN